MKRKRIMTTILVLIIGIILGYLAALLVDSIKKDDVKIELSNLSAAKAEGMAKVLKDPKLENNKITDLEVNLNITNDKVSYTFDIENKGKKDIQITNLVKSELECEGMDEDGEQAKKDATLVCSNTNYRILNGENEIKDGDTIKVGEKLNLTFIIEYTNEALPDSGVNIKNINYNLEFKAQ